MSASILTIGCILGSGYVHGLMTNRWGYEEELLNAAGRLKNVPVQFGDWSSKGQQDGTIPDQSLEIGEIAGYLSRTYANSFTGAAYSVLVVCGRPGPISVHTPDVCFPSTGFNLMALPSQMSFRGTNNAAIAECQLGHFVKQTAATTMRHRVYWMWSANGAWKSPDNPRLQFAGENFLYKIYVSRAESLEEGLGKNENRDQERDRDDVFMGELLPVLNESLFGRPPQTD